MDANIANILLTPEMIKSQAPFLTGGYMQCKFVRIGDEYRFADEFSEVSYCPTHAAIAGDDRDRVVSAGTIKVYEDSIWIGGYSETLNSFPIDSDHDLLTQLFGLPEKEY